jgi:hypothetical protein
MAPPSHFGRGDHSEALPFGGIVLAVIMAPITIVLLEAAVTLLSGR